MLSRNVPTKARSETLTQAVVAFEPTRLALAREWRGLTRVELGEKIGSDAPGVLRFESGQKRPDPATLARLSLALKVSVDFFARGRVAAIAVESCHFRHLRAGQQLDRRCQLAIANLLGDVLELLARHVTFPRHGLSTSPRRPASTASIEMRAIELRRRWGLGLGPIEDLTRLLESWGILVHVMPAEHAEIHSFSLHHGRWPMIFLVRGTRAFGELRLEMAHELGHLVMHAGMRAACPGAEAEADRFAEAFLVPARTFTAECPDWLDWHSLGSLAERWGVPVASIVERGFQLECFSEATYRRAVLTQHEQREPARVPKPEALGEGPSLLSEAFQAIATILPFEKVASQLGLSSLDLAHVTGTSAR
jgi:Zn-dependent peptidase ImmA (M78 family)